MTNSVGLAIAGLALLSVSSCVSPLVPLPPPASPRTLSCSLETLERLGYQVRRVASGSAWYQATRPRGGSGEHIWIRLVDDGRTAAWLEVRVSSWDQAWRAPKPDESAGLFQVRRSGLQGEEDVRAALIVCEDRIGRVGSRWISGLP